MTTWITALSRHKVSSREARLCEQKGVLSLVHGLVVVRNIPTSFELGKLPEGLTVFAPKDGNVH